MLIVHTVDWIKISSAKAWLDGRVGGSQSEEPLKADSKGTVIVWRFYRKDCFQFCRFVF